MLGFPLASLLLLAGLVELGLGNPFAGGLLAMASVVCFLGCYRSLKKHQARGIERSQPAQPSRVAARWNALKAWEKATAILVGIPVILFGGVFLLLLVLIGLGYDFPSLPSENGLGGQTTAAIDDFVLQRLETGSYLENQDPDSKQEFTFWVSLWTDRGENVGKDGELTVFFVRSYGCEQESQVSRCDYDLKENDFKKISVGQGDFKRERIAWAAWIDTAAWPCSEGQWLDVIFRFTTPGGQRVENKESFFWSC